MYLAGAYSDMSDADLDGAYASTFAGYQSSTGLNKVTYSQALSGISMEILDRLQSVWSFASGVFGSTRFPQYDAIQKAHPELKGFQQVSTAQTAVKQSAANVTSSLKFGVMGIAAAGVALVLLAAYLKGRK